MRTREARKLRRQALRHARIYGHQPVEICHEGALNLFACRGCNALLEVWDSPNIVNGPMHQDLCVNCDPGWLQRIAIRLISR
jgi:hypothetical protein